MDKINAPTQFKANNYIALVDLKAMNKKYAFTVGQNEPKRMDQIRVSKISDVLIAKDNFQEEIVLIIMFFGWNTHKGNKLTINFH